MTTGERLVKIRNPWGAEGYKGDWSDNSDLWTDQAKQEAGWVNDKGDGVFFMTVEDYQIQASETFLAKDVSDWHSGSFLKLDDPTPANGSDNDWWCDSTCVQHDLTLTSEVD